MRAMHANWHALGAIALWATLASLGVSLAHVPPFLLTGLALVIGSVPAWPLVRQWRVPATTLALGVYGLFGFHFLLFIALRHAPPVEANLVNYLWPLFIVVLAPLFLPGLRLRAAHAVAAVVGFAGAAIAILGSGGSTGAGWSWGYLPALGAAVMWSTYSLLTRRFSHFPTSYVTWFCVASGLLALACHLALEPGYTPRGEEWLYLVLMGLGPMGAAFFLWDRALKRGDPRSVGNLAYLAPLLSTLCLVAAGAGALATTSIVAMALILAGAWLGR